MPDRLPIQDAKEIAHKRGLRQVILLAWDGELSHVVTYGKSVEDCDQAAQGGEKMKKLMGWPNWKAAPSRVKRLLAALEEANEVCRFAYQVASRGGAETNWPAFTKRLEEALDRQHKIMHPDAHRRATHNR